MKKNRLIYLTVLAAAAVLNWFLPGRLNGILLLLVLVLPVLSLVLSIPALCTTRLTLEHPDQVLMGEEVTVRCAVEGVLPRLPVRGRMQGEHLLDGTKWTGTFPAPVPADHCGGIRIRVHRLRMYDYLGLLPVYLRWDFSGTIVVRPPAMPMPGLGELPRSGASGWKAKPGGGFGENHDLRPYRPGDHLRQIHWKMTAKTGKLMYRETLVPDRSMATLQLDLTGSSDQLDRKIGRMRWLAEQLLMQEIQFDIRAHTGDGVRKWTVGSEEGLRAAMDELLCCRCAPQGTIRDAGDEAMWSMYIGGDPDEN